MSGYSRPSLHVLALSASILAAVMPAHAGEWQFTPDSRLGSGYTANPRFLPEGGRDELQNSAEMGAKLQGRTERLELSITPRATFSRNRSDASLDTSNQYLGIATSWQSERVVWNGDAQFIHDSTQNSELGTTGLIEGNSRRKYAAVGAGGRWTVTERLATGADVQWSDVQYATASSMGLADYSRSTASLYGSVSASDRSLITLNARGGCLVAVGRSLPTTDYGLTLGLSHELGPLWSVSVSVGPSWADSGQGTLQGTLYSADLTRRGDLTQLSTRVSRQLIPVGTGYLTLMEAFTLSATQRLTEKWSATLSGQATRYRELFSDAPEGGRNTRYVGASASLNWNFARSWMLSLSAEQRYQQVALTSGAGSADSQRVWMGIVWSGRTKML